MKKIYYLSILLLFASVAAGSIKEDTEELIRGKLGESIETEFIKFKIPPSLKRDIENETRQRFYGDFVYIYKIFKDEKLVNYAVVDNVYGKSMPITFLVIYNTDAVIEHSGIIKYREQYGGGVKSEEWNSQFKGKNSDSGYTVGKEVSAISGATISANSVSRGIKKLTLLLNNIKESI